MPDTVPAPTHDPRWHDAPATPAGEFDRDVWLALARDVYDLDPDALDDLDTPAIVARCRAEPTRYYRD